MCGIHGFIDRQLSETDRSNVMGRMIAATAHRGPDYSSFKDIAGTVLGHNRLSILDLSEESHQPMIDGQLTIAFNGEIYNYKEIRAELMQLGHFFRTQSDTEVILKSYIQWGNNCVQRFEGMWAFAIWNDQTKQLFCSRDRFGIKPFYYLFQSGRLYFASEVKSLKHSPLFRNELNIHQIGKAIQLGWFFYEDETLYKTVKVLQPGHSMVWSNENLTISQYWRIPDQRENTKISDPEAIEGFSSLFDDAINKHLRSDVPLGATLSGGLDSSAIVCSILNDRKIDSLSTYSVFYEGKDAVDERPFVYDIVNKYGASIRPSYLSPSPSNVVDEFERITWHCDFPLLGSSPISQYFVMKEIAKDGIKVILSGQGADDYLGGYEHSYYRLYADMWRSMQCGRFFREFRQQGAIKEMNFKKKTDVLLKSGLSLFLSEEQLYNLEYKRFYPQALNERKDFGLPLNPAFNNFSQFHQALMSYSSLPTLLHYEDRNSMASSIESRVPFLDHRLVEYGFSLGNSFKIRDGYQKWIMRQSLGSSLPDSIRLRRDKKGFVTPGEVRWLREDLRHMLNIDYSALDFLNKEVVEREIREFLGGKNRNANFIWRLMSLNYWITKNA